MSNIIAKPKVQMSGFVDVLETGFLKAIAEKMIAKTPVGNGTLMSGVVKMIAGGVVSSKMRNKHTKLLGNALVIDGAEDMVLVAMSRIPVLGGSSEEAGGW